MSDVSSLISIAGGGGVVAGVLSKIVFDWLKGRNGNSKSCTKEVLGVLSRIENLTCVSHEVHSKCDSTGVPLCYAPRSTSEGIEKLIAKNTAIDATLKALLAEFRTLSGILVEIAKKRN